MTEQEQIEAFADELGKMIDRYMSEFDLTIASVMGILECAKLEVWESGGGHYQLKLE